MSLPRHIAIIMDGNGRWAEKRGLPRIAGHKVGSKAAEKAVTAAIKHKIEVLTLFAFSTENWNRPQKEVQYLMRLFASVIKRGFNARENNIQVRCIGDKKRLSPQLQRDITTIEQDTAKNTGLKLALAISYSGRWDIMQATQKIAEKVATGLIKPTEINEATIEQHLCLNDLPPPDLFIRTSDELRISNFLLWQLAYTELYFTKTLWPDFSEADLEEALDSYAKRKRKFGLV